MTIPFCLLYSITLKKAKCIVNSLLKHKSVLINVKIMIQYMYFDGHKITMYIFKHFGGQIMSHKRSQQSEDSFFST